MYNDLLRVKYFMSVPLESQNCNYNDYFQTGFPNNCSICLLQRMSMFCHSPQCVDIWRVWVRAQPGLKTAVRRLTIHIPRANEEPVK